MARDKIDSIGEFRRIRSAAVLLVKPPTLLLLPVAAWTVLRVAAPFDYRAEASTTAILTASTALVFGLFGAAVGASLDIRRSRTSLLSGRTLKAITMTAAVGLVLRYVDLLVLRGYLGYGSATNFRLQYATAEAETTPVQLAGALASSLALLPLVLHLLMTEEERPQWRPSMWSAGALALLWALYGVLRGGRSTVTVAAAVVGFAWLLGKRRRGQQLGGKGIFWLAGGAAVVGTTVVVLSAGLLQDRLTAQGQSPLSGFMVLEQHRGVVFDEGLIDVATEEKLARQYTAVSLIHYLLHGPREYQQLVVYREQAGLGNTWGATTFAPVARVLSLALPVESADRTVEFYAPAVFTTFLGPLLVDFGPVGSVVVSVLFCTWAGRLYRRTTTRTDPLSAAVYCLVATVLLHAPQVNLLESATIFFPLCGWLAVRAAVARVGERA